LFLVEWMYRGLKISYVPFFVDEVEPSQVEVV
jgi:hypothetical protein